VCGRHQHPPHTPRTSEPDCLGLILWPVAPPHFLCTLRPFYSRGSGGGLQPPPYAAGSLGCVLGWSMDPLSYGRHSCCARVHLFAFLPPLVGVELGH
jgi:hypothetical protein